MYIPPSYRIADPHKITEWMDRQPFGILVAQEGSHPMATHMPFQWRHEGSRLLVEGHVARANRIWRVAPHNDEVMVIFSGPHTYISSSWYHEPNVPTWNYVAVHVYGICRLMSDQELQEAMERLLEAFEGSRPNGRTWDTLAPEFRQSQLRAIVGVSIDVTHIDAAQKMSQNREDQDFQEIVRRLSLSDQPADQDVSEVMRTIRPDLFP